MEWPICINAMEHEGLEPLATIIATVQIGSPQLLFDKENAFHCSKNLIQNRITAGTKGLKLPIS